MLDLLTNSQTEKITLNHAVTRTDAAGAATQSFYDVAGQLVKTISPAGRTTLYSYDARGLLTSVTDPFGRAEVYEYNNLGQRTKMTDRRGFSTLFAYDAAGRMTSMTNGLGGSVQFSYDAAGQLASVTNPLGKTTSYTYDALGNKATQTDPLGRTYHYAYDNQGRLVTKTDARGIVVNYAYDLLDRLTTVTHPGGTTSYSYDVVGNVAAVTDPTGTTSFSYDAAARVTAIAAPQGTLTYQYDAAGQRTNMTLPGNRVVGYTYNAAGRRSSMTDWLGGVESFSYDADGNLTGVNRPNNVNTVYGYDAGGRLTGVTHNGPNGALLQYTYTLDENSNRIKVVSPTGAENYTLDALSRLTNVTYGNGDTASYTYDANGNRTSQTVNGATTNYSYDDAGELLSDGATNYTYDANGNLTAAGADSYTWDWANRLTGATVGGNSAAYSYDAADLRVGATVNGTTSNYLWDRQADIPQLLDDGSHAYLYGEGPLAQIDAGGNRQYLLTDALNSVRGLADNSGNLLGTADYGVFGALRGQTGAASALGFTGGLFTATTGLLHLNARDLSLNLGRFLSADTVQPNAPGTQGYNLYAYVANNPTTWVDPSGHNIGTMPMPQPLFDPQQFKDLLLLGASAFVRLLGGLVAFPWIWTEVLGAIIFVVLAILLIVIVIYLVRLILEFKLKQPIDSPLGGPLPPDKAGPNPDKTYPHKPDIPKPDKPEPEKPTEPKKQDQICENLLDCPIPPKDQIPDDDPACAPDVTYLIGREVEIHEALLPDERAYNSRTVAVFRIKRNLEGSCIDVVGSSSFRGLTAAQSHLLDSSREETAEHYYSHAEETVIYSAWAKYGLLYSPIALGASRTICEEKCQPLIHSLNGTLVPPKGAVWQ